MVNYQETLLSSSPGKDSGFESAEDNELLPLDKEHLLKIRTQVEFYLSDEVVTKDQFLLKHVTKSKEGWLSLKLMSSFRKVKSMCKGYDWRVVAEALKDSQLLEVSEDGSKVRRKKSTPMYDETRPARSIFTFSESRIPTLENLTATFGQCGRFVSTKLIKSSDQLDDSLRKVFSRYPKCRQLTCAVIEFDRSENAMKARALNCSDYRVVLLKDCLKQSKSSEKVVNRERRTFSDSDMQTAKVEEAPLSWRNRAQPLVITKPRSRSFGNQNTQKTSKDTCILNEAKQPVTRPRRLLSFIEALPTTYVCTIRQPRGPDGTRGFHCTVAGKA